jgi:HK97 gp10 family phage protein
MTSKLDTRVLDAIAKGLDKNNDQVLASVAFQVEAEAKAIIIQKHIIEFGNLLNSVETDKKKPGLYWVQDGVEYGVYQELGTYKMAARPFMKPAVEKVIQYLADLYRKLFP